MKNLKITNALLVSACTLVPTSACTKMITPFFAIAKSSLYVGDVFTANDILVLDNGKQVPYDKTGENGFKIDDEIYNIGHWFTSEDVGQHQINIVYKTINMSVTITVTHPRVITPKFQIQPYTHKFYKTPKIANKIYVVDVPNKEPYKNFRSQWYTTLESLEGILAQEEARIFVNHDVPQRNSWIYEAQKECGFEIEEITPEQALTMFADSITDHKVVTYSGNGNSINQATVISAANKYLMCDNGAEFFNKIKSLGFSEGINATQFSSEQVFNQYKDKLNNKMLINQDPTNIWLRDYAIASKSFTTYLDIESSTEFKENVMEWVENNAPVLGWTKDELGTVDLLSQYNKVIFPSDNCANLSFYTTYTPKENHYQVHNGDIIPQQGKHYVAIVMSDGDNAQWIQNDWWEEKWFGNKNRGSFPMNWTLNPSLLDLNPQIIDKINRYRTANDYFVCSGSGYGYINYSKFPQRQEFSETSATYMKNNDMTIAYYLEPQNKNPENYTEAFNQNQVKGGIWAYGDKYAAGKGGVYWINDKPLICCRETLWNDGGRAKDCFKPENMASRINDYSTDPTSISGYTIVNCHSWSYGTMDQITNMVNHLDKHVEVVTCEQLINMVINNVPHENVEQADKYPWYYD